MGIDYTNRYKHYARFLPSQFNQFVYDNNVIFNKYLLSYIHIITNSKYNGEFVEIHHILPRALGGSDSDDNLIKLSPFNHFICHWLLQKFTKGKNKVKMTYPLLCVGRGNKKFMTPHNLKIISMRLEESKKEISISMSILAKNRKPWSDERKVQQSIRSKGKNNPLYGKRHKKESLEKMIKSKLLKNKSTNNTQTKEHISKRMESRKFDNSDIKKIYKNLKIRYSGQRMFYVKTPDNRKITVLDAKNFCRYENLSYKKFLEAAKQQKKYLQYKIEYYDKEKLK